MNRKRILIGLTATLLCLMVVVAGCRHHATPREKLDRVVDYLTDDLDLTPDQTEILDRLKDDVAAQIVKAKSAKEQARYQVMAEIKSNAIDQEKVMAAIDGVRSEIDVVIKLVVARVAEFHSTLTPEQRDELVDKLEDLHKLHGHH